MSNVKSALLVGVGGQGAILISITTSVCSCLAVRNLIGYDSIQILRPLL